MPAKNIWALLARDVAEEHEAKGEVDEVHSLDQADNREEPGDHPSLRFRLARDSADESVAGQAVAECRPDRAQAYGQAKRDQRPRENKSGEQLRQELRQKAEEESRRTVEAARKEIEAERDEAVRSVRREVSELVVAATEKVIGETLDDEGQRKLIDRAIAEVASGDGSR